MSKIALASASILFASVVSASAMPNAPLAAGLNNTAVVQVKSKHKMGHMSGKQMKGHNMKGMDGMKGGSMKGMKGM